MTKEMQNEMAKQQAECEPAVSPPSCPLPPALSRLAEIHALLDHRLPVFFLDFDGTLTPIVAHPELVNVSAAVRQTLSALGARFPVCVVSGRDLPNLLKHLQVPNVFYAGDHGHCLQGPAGSGIELKVDGPDSEELRSTAKRLEQDLQHIEGAVIEVKQTSLSVHYRLVSKEAWPLVEKIVQSTADLASTLSLKKGNMVLELRPRHSWNKGSIVRWLVARLGLDETTACPICIGDDLTDEDMYEAAGKQGIGIVVAKELDRPTKARYSLTGPDEVMQFLNKFLEPTPPASEAASF